VIKQINVLWLLSLLPWGLFAATLLLFMDTPTPTPSFQAFRIFVFSYPIAVILSRFASSRATQRNKPELALSLAYIPAAWVLVFFYLMLS
jgi:hypothetical protein